MLQGGIHSNSDGVACATMTRWSNWRRSLPRTRGKSAQRQNPVNRWSVATTALALGACTFDTSARFEIASDAAPAITDADLAAPDADPSAPDANSSFDAAPGPPDASAPDAAACPTDYVKHINGSCYRTVSASATWSVAEADVVDASREPHPARPLARGLGVPVQSVLVGPAGSP